MNIVRFNISPSQASAASAASSRLLSSALPRWRAAGWCAALALSSLTNPFTATAASEVVDVGDRLEIFVDRYLIDRLDNNISHVLGQPRPEEICLTFNDPWDGGSSAAYMTVIKDGGTYRMYYRGGARAANGLFKPGTEITCYAESKDGRNWVKPKLGIIPFEGSTANNIILAPDRRGFSHNFAAMLDDRPGVPADERYKGVGAGNKGEDGLLRFASPDGIHWRVYSDEVIFSGYKLDSHNVATWLPEEQCYAIYMRAWSEGGTPGVPKPRPAFRTIARSVSKDFKTWSEPVRMQFSEAPKSNLYTNATAPYFRAPHILIGLPHRLIGKPVVPREELEAYKVEYRAIGGSLGDVVLLSSRGGTLYDRTFTEAFVRPGLERGSWHARSLYASMGVVPTGEAEMSFYVSTNYMLPTHHIRRYSLRTDGFASLRASMKQGTMTTKPLRFSGSKLALNYWTSAGGSVRVELLDESGNPIPGYSGADVSDIVGNEIHRIVNWCDRTDLSGLAGRVVRLRFTLTDADLYSMRFEK